MPKEPEVDLPLPALPDSGYVYQTAWRLATADIDEHRRLRLDGVARYIQDVGAEHLAVFCHSDDGGAASMQIDSDVLSHRGLLLYRGFLFCKTEHARISQGAEAPPLHRISYGRGARPVGESDKAMGPKPPAALLVLCRKVQEVLATIRGADEVQEPC